MATQFHPPGNKLLAALPSAEQRRLGPLMTLVPLGARQVLHRDGEPIEHVYFPVEGICAIVMTMQNGQTAEVATVGDEGMVGISALLCGDRAPGDAIVQTPGTFAYCMPGSVFSTEMERRGPLYEQVCRYSHVLFSYLMQSAACNGLHGAEKRCAKWLLESHDRIRRDWFELTQEYLAFMLGVRRATVSMIAHHLQSAGVVAFRNKGVAILDRNGLEALACECYRAVRSLFDGLSITPVPRSMPS